jgi:hypothetical protein
MPETRWSLSRTLGTGMLVVVAGLWLVDVLLPAGWLSWWQGCLVGVGVGGAVGGAVGLYGVHPRPTPEP